MTPLEWKEDRVLILDQRKLPLAIQWVTVMSADEMSLAIKNMVLRGAPLIGIAAAYALALESGREFSSPEKELEHLIAAGDILIKARPTAVNLKWAVNRILQKALEAFQKNEDIKTKVVIEAQMIHEEDRVMCSTIARHGSFILPEGVVLTHCNTGSLATGGEGTAYAVLKEGFREKKVRHVFACEARPFLQGSRLTAFELKEDNIPFTLITDSMAGHFLSRGAIQSVLVGADRIAANGDTANKIGTYSLAVLAYENKVPFYVAAPTSSFDRTIGSGFDIPIEERDPLEVLEIAGIRIAPEGIKVANPAFDVTPARFIRGIITEKGVAEFPYERSIGLLLENNLNLLNCEP
jgi:methylthioribose-1-phosphate isomerase